MIPEYMTNKLIVMLQTHSLKLRSEQYKIIQDKVFRRKRLSTGANFVHVYLEIRDTGILKFNKFSM